MGDRAPNSNLRVSFEGIRVLEFVNVPDFDELVMGSGYQLAIVSGVKTAAFYAIQVRLLNLNIRLNIVVVPVGTVCLIHWGGGSKTLA